jgi:hypothetical protein
LWAIGFGEVGVVVESGDLHRSDNPQLKRRRVEGRGRWNDRVEKGGKEEKEKERSMVD